MRVLARAAAVAAFALTAAPAGAQVLFYNGDFAGGGWNSYYTQGPTPDDGAGIFFLSDFLVTDPAGWTVTGVFGQFAVFGASPPTLAAWEIRQNASTGSQGTFLFGGINAATVTFTGTPGPIPNTEVARINVGGVAPFTLGPGRYWLAISPVSSLNVPTAFLGTSGGAHAVNATATAVQVCDRFGSIDGEHCFNGGSVISPSQYGYSYGATGVVLSSTTPEPATVTLMAGGLLALAGVGARQRRVATE